VEGELKAVLISLSYLSVVGWDPDLFKHRMSVLAKIVVALCVNGIATGLSGGETDIVVSLLISVGELKNVVPVYLKLVFNIPKRKWLLGSVLHQCILVNQVPVLRTYFLVRVDRQVVENTLVVILDVNLLQEKEHVVECLLGAHRQ
jgi:hypothetical protein